MRKQIRILLVGDDSYDMYVKAFYQSFVHEGYKNVWLFATNHYMDGHTRAESLLLRAENKIAFGPRVAYLNRQLLCKAEEVNPELVFLYSARLVTASTLKHLRERGAKVFLYNNDNPFADYYPKYFWRHYKAGLQYADVCFVYRNSNIQDCKRLGCNRVELLRSYYIKERNYYMEDPGVNVPRVVFLGHYENDGRDAYIKALLDNGIEVGIIRRTWEGFEQGNSRLVKLENTHTLYNEMLNAAEIAIVFLSGINQDTYTRRCFEIPAVKTMMIAPFTEDIATIFKEDEEVVFYRNIEEFVQKVRYYLGHEEERRKIAAAGYCRLMRDGHEVKDRVEFIMDVYEECVQGIK